MENFCLLAVIVPMFNEESIVDRSVAEIMKVVQMHPSTMRLFVVNDGSQDKTLEKLYQQPYPPLQFQVVTYPQNRGYGAACLAGGLAALEAGFDYGLYMDADLTNDPNLIPQFYKTLSTNLYDVIKASRYVPGGGMRNVPFHRQAITYSGNKLASKLFRMGIKDCTNGFRAVRLSFLKGAEFKERGFPMILEELLLLKQKGARASEIPYILTSRMQNEGLSKFSYRPKVFYQYFKYALKAFIS